MRGHATGERERRPAAPLLGVDADLGEDGGTTRGCR